MLDVTRAYGLTLMFPERDTVIGASLRDYGEFARPEIELISAHLAQVGEPGCYVDVGGNIGSIALPVAAQHRRWKVIAIEAHRGLAGVLAANALNNQLYNVEILNAAVGAEPGLARFPNASLAKHGNFGTLGLHLNEAVPTEAVRMCTLDEVAPPETRFIKIDVEGFELEVLKGAGAVVERRSAAWLLEAHRSERDLTRKAMSVFEQAGYGLYWFFAPFITALSTKRAVTMKGVTGDMNFLALPPGAANLWSLPPASTDSAWPENVEQFAYMARYGFRPPKA